MTPSMPANEPVLSVDQLTFGFPGRPLFSRWSAQFLPGLTWVQGPNGTGKSTLLRLLGGALLPASGQLSTRGIGSERTPIDYRRHVFWLGPAAIAFDHLYPLDYAGFIAGLYPRFNTEQLRRHLNAFGLQPHLQQRITALSTGTQRKLALAVALSAGTQVLLLDEPLAALDTASLAHARSVLGEMAAHKHMACIVTSHELLGDVDARVWRLEAN